MSKKITREYFTEHVVFVFENIILKIAQEKTKTEKKIGFAKINDMEMTRK